MKTARKLVDEAIATCVARAKANRSRAAPDRKRQNLIDCARMEFGLKYGGGAPATEDLHLVRSAHRASVALARARGERPPTKFDQELVRRERANAAHTRRNREQEGLGAARFKKRRRSK